MSQPQTVNLPRHFRRIRLELAREPLHPAGDRHTGYTLLAPLDEEGRLDIEAARAHKEACRVTRFRSGVKSEEGYLRRRPGGSWAFHYDFEEGAEDDDPAYRLEDHAFRMGEYVTINEDEGAHTYRVVSVRPI